MRICNYAIVQSANNNDLILLNSRIFDIDIRGTSYDANIASQNSTNFAEFVTRKQVYNN